MKRTAVAVVKPKTEAKTVLETILEWSEARPAWQRDALRRIVAKGPLGKTDLQELVVLCKQGRGGEGGATPIYFEKCHLPASPDNHESVSLASIADVNGANNLAPGQTLSFEPNGLTVIYGHNGAGKSGYARILKRACRARHAGEIIPNIYDQTTGKEEPASAAITYRVGGKEQPIADWKDLGQPHPELSAVSVFDSDCASIHINEKNEVAFRPFGLDIPDELAEACQAIKEALVAEQDRFKAARHPVFGKPSWKENTAVGKALIALRHDTDSAKIKALGTLTEEELGRLTRLKEDLSKNPAQAAAEQKLKADNIKHLVSAVRVLEKGTADAVLSTIFAKSQDARTKREAARLAAAKAFSGEPLDGVGGTVWRALWDSARRYSMEIAYSGQPFPPGAEDAACVLCQQPLTIEARQRMSRFEEFVQKDTEQQAQQAEGLIGVARQELGSLKISTRSLKSYFQQLAIQNPALEKETRRFIGSARLRRYMLLKSLEAGVLAVSAPIESPTAQLEALETTLRAYAGELQKSAGAEERKKLEAELAELTDRNVLSGMTQTVIDEIERLKNIRFLDLCVEDTKTNAITTVGNNIADTVITPKLRDRFQEEIIKLAAEKVRVEIVRSGGKYGSPQYQIKMFAKPNAKVTAILSEGEQTCVALAAFLTELATAVHKSTLVFDDPVSSLDHRWRKKVAERLVEEAEHRQIIVFTHDVVFATDLDDLAGKKRAMKLVTVVRDAAGTGIVSEGLPWKGKGLKERIDDMEKAARDARTLYEQNRETDYAAAAIDVYNSLRASWERALEDIAFSRVVLRHRDYIDPKHLKKVTVLDETACEKFADGFKKCCDLTDSHDASRGRNADPPGPGEMLKDIQNLNDWVTGLKEKQRAFA